MTGPLWIWRHPRAIGGAGRCIGVTDLGVDRRRAKRLAHRIRAFARRAGLPREIWTSPLQRAAAVGRVLRDWGWRHHVDDRLSELDFGRWDGLPWSRIDPADVRAWEADFADHAPGGGESQARLCRRVRSFIDEGASAGPRLAVGHAGWIAALAGGAQPVSDAARWPAPVPYLALQRWP